MDAISFDTESIKQSVKYLKVPYRPTRLDLHESATIG